MKGSEPMDGLPTREDAMAIADLSMIGASGNMAAARAVVAAYADGRLVDVGDVGPTAFLVSGDFSSVSDMMDAVTDPNRSVTFQLMRGWSEPVAGAILEWDVSAGTVAFIEGSNDG